MSTACFFVRNHFLVSAILKKGCERTAYQGGCEAGENYTNGPIGTAYSALLFLLSTIIVMLDWCLGCPEALVVFLSGVPFNMKQQESVSNGDWASRVRLCYPVTQRALEMF